MTSMRMNLNATKDELKDKDKKLKDVEKKFSAWRKRHPTKGLTMEFNSIDPTDTDKKEAGPSFVCQRDKG